MIKKLLLFIFILIAGVAKAQDAFIVYNSDAERMLLKSANTPADLLKLALVADLSESEAKTVIAKLDNDISQLSQENANLPAEQKIKKITQKLHAAFLQQYDNNASFFNMFNGGNYQCVGAAVLYAYVLEQYKIPYQIKEAPTHVYVVAYPDTYNITLETIDPKGFIGADEKVKQNYVNAMVKFKYATDADVDRMGTERVFDNFFYSKTSLNLKETVSLLYYNKAIEKIQAEKVAPAYSNILKAEALSPVKRNEFLRRLTLSDLISTLKFTGLRDWEAITYYVNNIDAADETKKYIDYQFDDLIQTKLWKEGQKDKVDEVYNYLHVNLNDTTVKNTIEGSYFYENGRYCAVSNKFPEALQYLEKAVVKNPNNLLIKSLIVDIVVQKMISQTPSPENVTLLNQYTVKFPFLAADPTMQAGYIYNYSYLSYVAFIKEDKNTGEKYMQLMRNELDSPKPGLIKNEVQIGNVFGKASEYYYRKQGKQKALQVLNAGLKYAPNNEQLIRKVKTIVDSGK